ncbi:MAG: slipin family protein [Candidatus Colwellbacteria bacterium]|nr:slipin family protein [Candidatus Colwellbacteria bacterium]
MTLMYGILIFTAVVLLLSSLRQIDQYQRGVMFTMGRFSGVKNPGWRLVIPIFQKMIKVDIRTKAVDVPDQKAITRDNISVRVSAVIYYKVSEASRAIIEVENFYYAVSQFAQTTMRNIVGEVELDELLGQREKISQRIKEIVSSASDAWGIQIENVELKDVALPEDMERTIAKQAEAERERRAVIIQSEGEVSAAENMAKAAGMLAAAPGALHLRTLQSINDVSSDQSNTIIFAIPLEVLRAFEKIGKDKE